MEEEIREEEVIETPEGAEESGEPAEIQEQEATTEEAIQPAPKKTAQERINELTKLRRKAEREREYWRNVALDKSNSVEQGGNKNTSAVTAKVEEIPNVPPRPSIENFETTEAYEEALVDWRLDIREARRKADITKAERKSAYDKFQREADKIREEYDDFDEVVERPVFTSHMRDAILASNIGPMLAYHLGRPENQQLAETIGRLSPAAQILEIGKIEANLTLAQKKRKPTGAPPPINPVGGSGANAITDESKLSDDEWFKLQQKKRLDALTRRYSGG